MKPNPKCPSCDVEMGVLKDIGGNPEFFVCPKCKVAHDTEELKPLAKMIC